MSMSRSLLVFVAAAASLAAQGSVGPLVTGPLREWSDLSRARLQVAQVKSISAIELPGDPPGTYYVGLTVTSLPATRGGMGDNDVLTGRYDVVTGAWTEDGAAAAINTTSSQFCMSLHSSGLLAAVDEDAQGRVVIARRASLSAPFARAGIVSGLPAQAWYDSSIATVDGQLHLLATINGNVARIPLDLTTLQAGTPVVLARPPAGELGNSSQPIVDRNGEMIALSFHSLPTSYIRNDHRVAYDLDSATPDFLVTTTGDWISNGTYLGSRYVQARNNAAGGYRLVGYDLIWSGGGRASIGTNMPIDTFAPASAASPWHGLLLVSAAFTAATPIPGVPGALGVSPLLLLDVGPHSANTGRAAGQLAIPNDASLAGARVPAQPLSLEVNAARLVLGNTCLLTVR
jgi:hypothetical protein